MTPGDIFCNWSAGNAAAGIQLNVWPYVAGVISHPSVLFSCW